MCCFFVKVLFTLFISRVLKIQVLLFFTTGELKSRNEQLKGMQAR